MPEIGWINLQHCATQIKKHRFTASKAQLPTLNFTNATVVALFGTATVFHGATVLHREAKEEEDSKASFYAISSAPGGRSDDSLVDTWLGRYIVRLGPWT